MCEVFSPEKNDAGKGEDPDRNVYGGSGLAEEFRRRQDRSYADSRKPDNGCYFSDFSLPRSTVVILLEYASMQNAARTDSPMTATQRKIAMCRW